MHTVTSRRAPRARRGRTVNPPRCNPKLNRDPFSLVYRVLATAVINNRSLSMGVKCRKYREMINRAQATIAYAKLYPLEVWNESIERDGGDLLTTFLRIAREMHVDAKAWLTDDEYLELIRRRPNLRWRDGVNWDAF
jgi:hypothetical protein